VELAHAAVHRTHQHVLAGTAGVDRLQEGWRRRRHPGHREHLAHRAFLGHVDVTLEVVLGRQRPGEREAEEGAERARVHRES
jgi:hypothetical protein